VAAESGSGQGGRNTGGSALQVSGVMQGSVGPITRLSVDGTFMSATVLHPFLQVAGKIAFWLASGIRRMWRAWRLPMDQSNAIENCCELSVDGLNS
jgi:hypothetical protein